MYRYLAIVIVIFQLASCSTTKHASTEMDSLQKSRIEHVDGVSLSSYFVDNNRTVDRFRLLVINEKGDTIREKDSICIMDSHVEIYKDSISRLKMTIDSLRNVKNKTITKTTVKTPWYATKDWVMVFCLLSFIPGVILGKRIAK